MSKETQGIIIKAIYGYNGRNKLTLKLEIQSFNGWLCTMIFEKEDSIKAIFDEFKSDYNVCSNTQTLIHRNCFLMESKGTKIPPAIAKLPPSEYKKYHWIYNDNEKYEKML